MAHLGGVYYQTVSAIAKSQELMVSFPLSHRPFSRLELNESERRRFHLQATELLGDALREYEEFALIRHRQVDRRRWKPVKNHENIAVYRESRSYAVSRSLSVEDEKTFARAAAMAPISSSTRRRVSRSSSSSGGSGSGSISTIHELPAHQATELELLTGWGPTATEVREHKKRNKSRSASVSGNLEQLPTLLGVGNIVGSLDDVMYGVAAPDCASMALKNAYAHEDVLDGDILCAIEGPSQRSPFRFLGIKWLVKSTTTGAVKNKLTSPRDLVYLEATGVITRGDGVRIGYQIMHSVKLLGCPELYDSHGVVRARYESVHLFVELDSRTVDVFLKSNVAPNGKVSESAALQSCANSLLYCGKTVQCSQDKKLTWQLQCNQSIDRQGTNVKPTRCSICNKSFGRFLRHSIECKLCSTAMCSKCCVERTLKSVDASGNKRHVSKFVSTSVIELCTSCFATNMQTSALTIAREEVMAGRFGPVPPRRGSDHSNDSVGTICIDDIPDQREHHPRPPLQSESNSKRGHRSQNKEDGRRSHRSHRDEAELEAHPEDPVSRRGYASPSSNSSHMRELPKIRTRSGSRHEPVPARQPTFRRGHSAEAYAGEDRYMQRESISRNKFHPVYGSSPVELDNSGRGSRGLPVNLSDLEDSFTCTPSKESIRRTTSSSDSSFESIHISGISSLRTTAQEPEAEKEEEDIRDTFDSFGDLIDIHDDLDDVVETLDTKDMEAVKRASQVNRNLWQQIADLRDAAENVYQYTKESTAMHMTQGGSVRPQPRLDY
ncbi:hypothetical protein PC129_g1194 [Phytophthora cactorum]|uniref:FYVE-type domain-containing protein n=1 Tax=Phytophthora cactorum TaxID=29920 RepID=A0A8T1DHZ1_9STRA|nr:hypothetical protein Pcac1_g20780 [Phytophthora cactorum]KAG2843562.1 hypothetical protein PC112_g2607 [Phytophthora cactorum]KAG2845030.1 hypothetical protein PC111_g1757 [Phytophthora cactorum]KAG2866765.1 hypothetical protein PC113_g2575 [Phytophthora cactorum]KAG2929543.1 hypothetical protein PC114_g2785 [Phytophthora cactorum]